MAIDSVTLAWQKAYYPLEFYKVTLQRYTNKGEKDKVALLKKEMVKLGIKLKPITFGDDNRKFSIDRENHCISQTMSSIKNMQQIVPVVLYDMSCRKDSYSDLFYIFQDLKASNLNKTSIDILFKLDYFREYGDINYILTQWKIYNDVCDIIKRLSECKQLKKDEILNMGLNIDIIRQYCNKETEKMFKEIDNKSLIMEYIYNNTNIIIEFVSKQYTYNPTTIIEKISYQINLIGYTELIDKNVDNDIYAVSDIEINQYGTPFLTLYNPRNGEYVQYKANKRNYNSHPCSTGDIVNTAFRTQNKRVKDNNGKWYNDPTQTEEILYDYVIVKNVE
jgi:DNA polymerase-3 subunit alpha